MTCLFLICGKREAAKWTGKLTEAASHPEKIKAYGLQSGKKRYLTLDAQEDALELGPTGLGSRRQPMHPFCRLLLLELLSPGIGLPGGHARRKRTYSEHQYGEQYQHRDD